jgi:hypothetical protein
VRRFFAAVLVLASPGVARADLEDPFTFALEVEGVRHTPESLRPSSADAAIGARLKFFRALGVDASATFGAVHAVDPAEARTVQELFPSPNVRLLGVLEPLTNRWFSPYLLGGAGWSTRTTSSISTLLAGFGLQIGMGAHVAVALDGFMLLPWPDHATSFVERNTAARLSGQKVPHLRLGDFVSASRHEVQVALRYYL